MILSDLEKENLAALAGSIYTFDPLIERGKTHNLYRKNECSMDIVNIICANFHL